MRPDQAEGLRRLLDRSGLRVVSISAGSSGAAETMINLAGALAELGNDVLIIDAHPAAHGVAAALGLKAPLDFEDVIRRSHNLDEVIVRGPAGLRILPLAHGARALARLPAPEQQRLLDRCIRPGFPVDTLLVDAAARSAGALAWSNTAAQEVIVIAGGGAAEITAAYASIKRLSREHARREFHILVANVASEREARAIFDNMAAVARRYLGASLHFSGHFPVDDKLQHAAQLRLPVVAAFPAAAAAAGFRRLAQAVAAWPRADEEGTGFDDFMRRLIHSNGPRTAAA
jgi:flagellar biosynthesis protein FlhG